MAIILRGVDILNVLSGVYLISQRIHPGDFSLDIPRVVAWDVFRFSQVGHLLISRTYEVCFRVVCQVVLSFRKHLLPPSTE